MLALDIVIERGARAAGGFRRHVRIHDDARVIALAGHSGAGKTSVLHAIAGLVAPREGRIEVDGRCLFDAAAGIDVPVHERQVGYVFQDRSEEHTSELQSLMRISYAVFCLKKKQKT